MRLVNERKSLNDDNKKNVKKHTAKSSINNEGMSTRKTTGRGRINAAHKKSHPKENNLNMDLNINKKNNNNINNNTDSNATRKPKYVDAEAV